MVSRRAALKWFLASCLVFWLGGCQGKKKEPPPASTTSAKGKPTQTRIYRDAALKQALPKNTVATGFSLPVVSRALVHEAINVVDRGKGEPLSLQLGFTTGDKQSIEFLMTVRVGQVEARSTMAYDLEVVAVRGSGAAQIATLKLTFTKLTISSKSDVPRSREMAGVAAKIVGQTLVATIKSDGETKLVKTDPELAGLLHKLQLDPSQLLGHMYPRFPSGKLGVGAKWLLQLRTTNKGVTETIDLTYELASAVKSPRGLRITLDLVGKLTMTGAMATSTGNMRGQIALIPARGILTRASLRQDVRLKAQGGHAVDMSMLIDVIEKSASRGATGPRRRHR